MSMSNIYKMSREVVNRMMEDFKKFGKHILIKFAIN